MPWPFVESCVRGLLPAAECGPLYHLAAIVSFLLFAVLILVALVAKRVADERASPTTLRHKWVL